MKPRHAESMCKSQHVHVAPAEKKCACCGEGGHLKKDCPSSDNVCTECDKPGHLPIVCWHAANGCGGPKAGKKQQAAQAAASTSKTPQPGRMQPVAVQDGEAWWTHICEHCSVGIRDPDRIATNCPKCKKLLAYNKPLKAEEAAEQPSELGLLTKKARETEERHIAAGANGDLALPKDTQEATKRLEKLEGELSQLEGIEGDFTSQKAENQKKGIRKLKTRIPQTGQEFQDKVCTLQTLAEMERKHRQNEQILKDKLGVCLEMQGSIVLEGEKKTKLVK